MPGQSFIQAPQNAPLSLKLKGASQLAQAQHTEILKEPSQVCPKMSSNLKTAFVPQRPLAA
jgi:hypothetical protein